MTKDSPVQQRAIAVLDVGGTSIKSGRVHLPERTVSAQPSRPFDAAADATSVLGDLAGAARSVLDLADVQPGVLAVAFPGPFDYRLGRPRIRGQRKFDSIWDVDLTAAFRRLSGRGELDVRYANDADAAAWGEATSGAGRERARFLMVTLGTGFGGSVVDRGHASAPGPDENVAARLYERPVDGGGRADDVLSAHGLAVALNVDPGDLGAAAVRARHGDQSLMRSFAQFGDGLGRFLAPIAVEFEVEAVVVGGGVAASFDLFGPTLASRLDVAVAPAELASTAALVGASLLFAPGSGAGSTP